MSEELERDNLLAKWLAGNLTEQERQKLSSAEGLEELKYIVNEIDTWQLPPMDVEKNLRQLKTRLLKKTPARKFHVSASLKVAAAITLVLGVCLSLYVLKEPGEVQLQTALGEKLKHTLPDGSEIELDALSTLNYSPGNWQERREMTLTGRAYFNVFKGSAFIVKTKRASITVLGTRFDVSDRDGTFTVNCFEGSVEVKAGTITKIIGAGETVSLKKGRLEKQGTHETVPSWTQGQSSYRGAPLSRVIADLKLYYKVDIALPERYNSLLFTGMVPHHDLEAALQAVFLPMEIKYTLTDTSKVVFD